MWSSYGLYLKAARGQVRRFGVESCQSGGSSPEVLWLIELCVEELQTDTSGSYSVTPPPPPPESSLIRSTVSADPRRTDAVLPPQEEPADGQLQNPGRAGGVDPPGF